MSHTHHRQRHLHHDSNESSAPVAGAKSVTPTPRFSPDVFDPFCGQNGLTEIETYDEFLAKTASQAPESLRLSGWMFQGVDFSNEPLERWEKYDLKGASFFGCTFPPTIKSRDVRARGANVWREPTGMPFQAFRPFLYNQEELRNKDSIIAKHYTENHDLSTKLAQSIHDFSVLDALHDYLEGKTPVGFMGGHKTPRASEEYRKVTLLARLVARAGFLVVTGGGAGSMEAANLGAYLANRSEEEAEAALKIIAEGNEEFEGREWENPAPAEKVLATFGPVTYMPSLGIPTFRYTQEPPNLFATYHAKFFSNALREDGLLAICYGGIIYGQGGPGTRQEIFQAACHNSEVRDPSECRPMLFMGKDFWYQTGIPQVLQTTSKSMPFYKLLHIEDSHDAIISHLLDHAQEKKYPLIQDLESLKEEFWMK